MVRARVFRISARGTFLLTLTGLALLGAFFAATPTAYAAGAVGPGGGGGGAGGAGDPHTRNGHGWVSLGSSGAGPNAIDGQSWASISATCRGVGATTVVAYVVSRPDGTVNGGAIYTFPSSWAAFQGFRQSPAPYIALGTAQGAFNSLSAADRAGFTFGVNVGWFCYNFAPPPPPPTVVNCGGLTVNGATEPIQNYSNISLTGYVTYSGGPAGAPAITNTWFAITPQYPGGFFPGVGVAGNTVSLSTGNFVPSSSGLYTATWNIQVNERWVQCSGSFVVYPPTVLTCGTADSIPVQPEVNTPIRIAATGGWTGGPPTITSGNLSINVAPTPGNVPLQSSTVSGGNVDMTSQLFTPVTAGIYTITWTFRVNEAAVITCSDTFPVLNHPFFDVNGGDVLAGTAFSTTAGSACAASPAPHNPDAGVVGWNNRTSPAFAGTGIDYAAFALNYVQDAATSRANTAANAQALAFANVPLGAPASVTPASGLFGGMFGSISTCVDYWGAKPPDGSLTPWTSGNVSGTATGKYTHTGNLTIGGGNIGNNRQFTLYVNGDVYISSNIVYNGNNGWTRPEQIPSFTLVVYGRIFISEAVNQLDGVYVAVPDNVNYADPAKARDSVSNPRRGTILTCAPAGFSGHTLLDIANNPGLCDGNGAPLRVNGSLIGAQLFLLRTLGSVTTGQPAEIFNYSPEVWMAPSGSSPVGTDYDSVVGLPPVL